LGARICRSIRRLAAITPAASPARVSIGAIFGSSGALNLRWSKLTAGFISGRPARAASERSCCLIHDRPSACTPAIAAAPMQNATTALTMRPIAALRSGPRRAASAGGVKGAATEVAVLERTALPLRSHDRRGPRARRSQRRRANATDGACAGIRRKLSRANI
jgi:hypothetical protein